MIDTRTAPYAAFILRLSLGVLFLAHFSLKFLSLHQQEPLNFSNRWVCPALWLISR